MTEIIMISLIVLLFGSVFSYLFVKARQARKLVINCAKCFVPTCDKYKNARLIMKEKYKEAKKYIKFNTRNPFIVLQIILQYNPGSVDMLMPVSHMFPEEILEKFKNGKVNGFIVKKPEDRVITQIIEY